MIIPYFTVTAHSNVSPAACTEIVAVPGDKAFMRPVLSTVATVVLLLCQLFSLIALFFICNFAARPFLRVRDLLFNEALGTATEHEYLSEPNVAVIRVLPALTAVTFPDESTVAMEESSLVHEAVF